MLDRVGTELQLLSPRPFQMMHNAKPGRLVHWFTEETNNIIARSCKLLPQRFVGIAGLPQVAGEPIQVVLPELERCVKMGFRGCLLNPDPFENGPEEAPPLGDHYWYPLYERCIELKALEPALEGFGERWSVEGAALKRWPGRSMTSRWFGFGMPVAVGWLPDWMLWHGPDAPGWAPLRFGLQASAAVMRCDWLNVIPSPTTNLMYSPACQVAVPLNETLPNAC